MIEIMIGDCRERLAATDLAYAAGVIDSDGTIGVRRSTYSMRIVGDAKVPIFAARVCVKQCQPEAVQLLKAMFGGSLRMNAPSATNGRPLHGWEVTHRRAINMLLAIRPYLRIKAAQADNCFALADQIAQSKVQRNAKGRAKIGGIPRSSEITAAMEALYLRSKELNRVGVAHVG